MTSKLRSVIAYAENANWSFDDKTENSVTFSIKVHRYTKEYWMQLRAKIISLNLNFTVYELNRKRFNVVISER